MSSNQLYQQCQCIHNQIYVAGIGNRHSTITGESPNLPYTLITVDVYNQVT